SGTAPSCRAWSSWAPARPTSTRSPSDARGLCSKTTAAFARLPTPAGATRSGHSYRPTSSVSMSCCPGSTDLAARRRPRRQEAQLAFEALSIEGGLLSADWLRRAAQPLAGNQSGADSRLPKGLNLRDEIGRYWRIAQAHWSEFAAGRAGGADLRALAERFVHGLLRESFGFASLAAVTPVDVEGRTYPIGALALV